MTNEELLSVAEIVERATNRFNAQAAYHRERFDEHVKLIASMKADHEAKMVEHRAAFGARTEADAKIIAGLREESAKHKAERDHFYQREGIEQKRRMDAESERDALRAEVEFLKTLRPKYKVGDKLQLYPAIRYTPVTVVGVRTVYDCQADGAEYPVGHSEDELTERYEQTPPEATHAEPDLTQLHAKGKEAWSDVPNATQWVEEMRGNSEATHDTEAGKAVAESAVKTEPVTEEIKVGDLGEVFQATTRTLNSDVGITGCVSSIHLDPCHGGFLVKFDPSTQSRRSAGMQAFGLCDVRKVTT